MVFLEGHGVGTSRAVRIFKTYGGNPIPLVKENPYRLARDIRGIGFITADQIAQKLGIPKTSILRARAGITYALLQAVENGDCGLPEAELLTLAQKLLEVERGLLAEAVALELAGGSVVADTVNDQPCVFLPHLRHAEDAIAMAIRHLQAGRPPWAAIDAVKAIDWVEARLGVRLAPGQRDAVSQALSSKILIVTGGPGVGKDNHHPRHPDHPASEGCDAASGGAKRPGCQAPVGNHRARSKDHPSAARVRSEGWRVRPVQGLAARVRPAGAGRDIHDRRAADGVCTQSAAAHRRAPDRRRRRSAAVGRPWSGTRRPDRERAIAGRASHKIFRQANASRIIVNAHRVNAGAMPEVAAPDGDSDFSASAWWFSSASGRRSQSQSATFKADGDGRSCGSCLPSTIRLSPAGRSSE